MVDLDISQYTTPVWYWIILIIVTMAILYWSYHYLKVGTYFKDVDDSEEGKEWLDNRIQDLISKQQQSLSRAHSSRYSI